MLQPIGDHLFLYIRWLRLSTYQRVQIFMTFRPTVKKGLYKEGKLTFENSSPIYFVEQTSKLTSMRSSGKNRRSYQAEEEKNASEVLSDTESIHASQHVISGAVSTKKSTQETKKKVTKESKKLRESFGKKNTLSAEQEEDDDYVYNSSEEVEESDDSFIDNRSSDEMTPIESGQSDTPSVDEEIEKQQKKIDHLKAQKAAQLKKRPAKASVLTEKKAPMKKRRVALDSREINKIKKKSWADEVEEEDEMQMEDEDDEESEQCGEDKENKPYISTMGVCGAKKVVNLTPQKIYKLCPIKIRLNSAWSVFTDVVTLKKGGQGPFDVITLERSVKTGTSKDFRMNIPIRHLESLFEAVTLFEKQIIAKKTIRPTGNHIRRMIPKDNVIDLRDLEAKQLRQIWKEMNVENGHAPKLEDAEFQTEYQFGPEGRHFIVRLEDVVFTTKGGGTANYDALTIARYLAEPLRNGKHEFTCSLPANLIPYLKGALEFFLDEQN